VSLLLPLLLLLLPLPSLLLLLPPVLSLPSLPSLLSLLSLLSLSPVESVALPWVVSSPSSSQAGTEKRRRVEARIHVVCFIVGPSVGAVGRERSLPSPP